MMAHNYGKEPFLYIAGLSENTLTSRGRRSIMRWMGSCWATIVKSSHTSPCAHTHALGSSQAAEAFRYAVDRDYQQSPLETFLSLYVSLLWARAGPEETPPVPSADRDTESPPLSFLLKPTLWFLWYEAINNFELLNIDHILHRKLLSGQIVP